MASWEEKIVLTSPEAKFAALAHDFCTSRFEENEVSSEEIARSAGVKSLAALKAELDADEELDFIGRNQLLRNHKRFLMGKDTYHRGLLSAINFLRDIKNIMPREHEGLSFEVQSNLEYMQELYIALSAWDIHMRDIQRQQRKKAEHDPHTTEGLEAMDRQYAKIRHQSPEMHGLSGHDIFSLSLGNQATAIAQNEKELNNCTAPIKAGKETLESARNCLFKFEQEFSDVDPKERNRHKEIHKSFSILNRMLNSMIKGYEELEIEKGCDSYTVGLNTPPPPPC